MNGSGEEEPCHNLDEWNADDNNDVGDGDDDKRDRGTKCVTCFYS